MSQAASEWIDHYPDHDHYLLLYESQEDQFASVAPLIQDGLEAGDKWLYVAYHRTEEEVISGLQEHDIDVDTALHSDQLEVLQADDVYVTDGSFDPDQMVDCLKEKLAAVQKAGYTNLRITGETTWLLEHDIDLEKMISYERQVDELYVDTSMVGVCQYHRPSCPPGFISDLLQTHPLLVYDAECQGNCYYQLPEEHQSDRCDQAAIDRKLKTISEQHRLTDSLAERERCLSLLGQYTEQLREADPGEIEQIAGDIITEIIDPSLLLFWDYDTDTGELRDRVLQHSIQEVSSELVLEELSDRAWRVFVEDELQEVTFDEPTVSGALVPVGQHGVFFIGTPASTAFEETDRAFVKSVCGHTEAALDHLTYERELEAKNTRLSEQNTELDRVNQINTVIRKISNSLVDAAEEAEVIQAVCDRLAQETEASFVWYGSYDPTMEALQPSHTAGNGQGYLTALAIDDKWPDQEPAGQAARTRTPEKRHSILDPQPLATWQKQALKRDFQSVVSLPVSFNDSLYGVLSLYSDTPNAFTGETATVLNELSDLVAHAISSIRRKEALVTESVTELKVRLTDTNVHVVTFVSQTNARVEIDEMVSDPDGGFRIFMSIQDTTPAEIREFGKTSPTIETLEILSDDDEGYTCECIVTSQCFMAQLLSHNAVPQSVHINDGEAMLRIRLPQDVSGREFMEMFTEKYPDADVVGRYNREQSLRQLSDIDVQVENALTDRQQEILTLAYHSGYFDRPRERTAEDLADTLDVSHPTVTRHLREAERKILSLLYDG